MQRYIECGLRLPRRSLTSVPHARVTFRTDYCKRMALGYTRLAIFLLLKSVIIFLGFRQLIFTFSTHPRGHARRKLEPVPLLA
jgi:hypothetical protein